MEFNGSKTRYFLFTFAFILIGGMGIIVLFHFILHHEIAIFPEIYGVTLGAFIVALLSKSIWNIKITETGIIGPVVMNRILIASEFRYDEISKIKTGMPIWSNYYLESSTGFKMVLHFPYLSIGQINKIIELIKSKSMKS
jgi:hypothetical protein